MSSAPVTLDMSQAQPIQQQPVTLDMSKAAPLQGAAPAQRTWLDSAKDFASGVWQQINPASGFKGAAQLAAHPIDTYEADATARQELLNKAQESFKNGDYLQGTAHALYGIIPFLGPQMESAGEDIGKGKVAAGVGKSVGMGAAIAGPSAVANALRLAIPQPIAEAAGGAAQKLYRSALKPSTVLDSAKVAAQMQEGMDQGITVSPGGAAKLGDLIDDLNGKISAQIAANPNVPISRFAVASRLGDTADAFKNQVNPASDLAAVQKSGNEFMESQPKQILASDAQALKTGTYQQLKARAYGELGSATVESQKALARGLKEELATKFPELNDLNATDSNLIGLDNMMERAVNRISNHQLIGIGTPLAAAGAKAITGSNLASGITGVMKAVFDDPYVKSRAAIALNQASKGAVTIPMAAARFQAYVDALGNVATPPNPGGQANQ